ncbi:MAG: ATP-binding protein, partial [Bacteroidota bacterium]
VIQEIIQDKNGVFWISTTKGLSQMIETQEGFEFELYSKADGLQANEFFRNASYQSSAGEIFLGGINGFNHIDPDEFKTDPFPPKIQFTNFKLFNKAVSIGGKSAVLPAHINTIDQITLNKSQTAFSIDYNGLGLTSPEKYQYAYKLEGFDQNWNYVDQQKTATYTNLDPGDYVFMVTGANRDDAWSPNPRRIKIKILPPWWQTWWARLILIVSPLGLIISFIFLRFSFIKSQKIQLAYQVDIQTSELLEQKNEIEIQAQELRKVNQQKDKLFSIISHDLRSPIYSLQGITNMLDPEILQASDLSKIKSDISHKIENIGNVMVNLLDWSKSQMAGETQEIENFDISHLAKEMCSLYQSTAKEKRVKIVNYLNRPLMIRGDKNQVRIVLRNLIGNALKFTNPKDSVYIGYEQLPNRSICIKVTDTGVGMKEEQVANLFQIVGKKSCTGTAGEKGVGLGLLLVKEYVEKNGGSVFVNSQLGVGTTFRFSIPMAS